MLIMSAPSYLVEFPNAFFRQDLYHSCGFKADLRSLLLTQTFLFSFKEKFSPHRQTNHMQLGLSCVSSLLAQICPRT